MTPAPISRRRAIILGGLGAASLAAGGTGWIAAGPGVGTSRLEPADTGAELHQPPVLDSRDGRLQVELTAAAGARLGGVDTQALGFNGTSPGPTLRVRAGDELEVRLTNRLDKPTNLHTHGLRVSPQANSDNPFLRIDPGTSFDYRYRIPPDHPAGTFWYHPHHHGMVADQVFGGLAGALLVDPPLGNGPDLPVVEDRVLLVTDTTLDADGHLLEASAMDRAMGRQGELVLVNGQHQPTIPAAPGATQRWRIINGCVSRVLPIRLDGHDLIQVAHDGTFLPAPATKDRVLLAPGNRADVIVRPTGTGRYPLIADAVDRGGMEGMMGGNIAASGPVTLATLVTDGPSVTAPPLPATLPAEKTGGGPTTARRQITFQMGMSGSGMGGMAFTIDGRTFDPARDDQTVQLGTTEEWTINNPSPLAHPFHLHVWPFTVLATSDGARPVGVPQDVVLVPARGWARLRIPFTEHDGRSVYHCHILDHEDAGMMATINVRG
ncbi:multicopper oxidase family protein [Pseudonocardia parietis]|uniref:FtsP/CotA-like multicopper oxidase with cupredoxin domain n=1 Tax=Pseudonocardia parietis TaxID=570936 RepID=A0ABS4W6Y8_9PSEU|nr:multicopper oxidase family protein [Pseudonocardia parietis]MBP2371756.1 FtsP/CotA-like multicopper oxidase with cupredoxin domain [Pseudonocardia parietis]